MNDQPKDSSHLGWRIVLTIILVLILISLLIPDVRASVRGWLGLSIASSNQMPAAPVTLVAVNLPTATAAMSSTQPENNTYPMGTPPADQVQLGSSSGIPADTNQQAIQSGLSILTPSFLPQGYTYQSAFFDTNNKALILTYIVTRPLPGSNDPSLTSSETITLIESLKNDFVPMQIAPDTKVTDLLVNGTPAEYTLGGWDTQFVKDSTAPNGGKMVSSWRNDLPVKNLFWQVGKVYLLLVTPDEAVSQQDLMDMAASVGK
jgi:hypothetical protein